MKYMFLFGFLIYSSSFFAQKQEESRIFSWVLKSGEQLEFGDNSIGLKAVISDSRCPKDVTCVWAGEAKVLIEIFEKGKLISEKLVIINPYSTDEIPLQFSAGDMLYSITTFRLYPYPSAASKKNKIDYSLEMQVSQHL